jgi:hypothetical protein
MLCSTSAPRLPVNGAARCARAAYALPCRSPAAAANAVVAAAGTFTFSGILAGYILPALVMGYSAVAYGQR